MTRTARLEDAVLVYSYEEDTSIHSVRQPLSASFTDHNNGKTLTRPIIKL